MWGRCVPSVCSRVLHTEPGPRPPSAPVRSRPPHLSVPAHIRPIRSQALQYRARCINLRKIILLLLQNNGMGDERGSASTAMSGDYLLGCFPFSWALRDYGDYIAVREFAGEALFARWNMLIWYLLVYILYCERHMCRYIISTFGFQGVMWHVFPVNEQSQVRLFAASSAQHHAASRRRSRAGATDAPQDVPEKDLRLKT